MKFEKYQHIERFGNLEVAGIEDGLCYVFPKIDGTNASLWLDNGQLKAGSRNRELTLEQDNAGFYAWALQNEKIARFFQINPDIRLYGEWLVPHTLKTYQEDAWKNFYIFDAVSFAGLYLHYEEYSKLFDYFDLDYIQPICTIKNPRLDSLMATLEKNTFLIKDGEGVGEGVVIKNYNFVNKFGRVTWAKIVRNEFKEQNKKSFGVPEISQEKIVEERIIDDFLTDTLIEKEYSKLAIEGWTSKMIPRLLQTVFYTLITEEVWQFLKKYKMPKIDFRYLEKLTVQKIKETKKEIF